MTDRPTRTGTAHERRIQQELLGYLVEHPGAMDTLEGIASWWLPRHEVRVGVELVARALEHLESDGLIERVGDPDRPLYRLRYPPEASGTGGARARR